MNISIFKLALICMIGFTFFIVSCKFNQTPSTGSLIEADDDAKFQRLMDTGNNLMNDRQHTHAIHMFMQAGEILPDNPEWKLGKASALFDMDQYEACADICLQIIDQDPGFYDVYDLWWSARLEIDGNSVELRKIIKDEIEALIDQRGDDIEALLAAYSGYYRIKDEAAQQDLIVELAATAASYGAGMDADIKQIIAARLFEQIISERKNKERKIKLMKAYLTCFPEKRFIENIVYAALRETQNFLKENGSKADPELIVQSAIGETQESYRILMGAGLWLIENNFLPDKALRLIQEGKMQREAIVRERPKGFTPELWQTETAKESDFLLLLLGRAWLNAGNPEKAKGIFLEVADRKRRWSDPYHFLAMIAREAGDEDSAIDYFRKSLEIRDKRDKTVTYLKDLLEMQHGYQGDPAVFFSDREGSVSFTDVTKEAGLSGISSRRAAWGDYDNDGLVDLLLGGKRLFKNTGNGRFLDVSAASGLTYKAGRYSGALWGDYNNDGFLDLFITRRSGNLLFENSGLNTFRDVTIEAFQKQLPRSQSMAAAWGDIDNDGFLDLYVANYERSGARRSLGVHDQLYYNNADGGFDDISRAAGIITDEAMCGRGVVWTDLNKDGYQDIVVANYRLDPNFMWVNKANNTFADQATMSGVRGVQNGGYFGHSIAPVSGDIDNDGNPDLFISNLAHPRHIEFSDQNMLLINSGTPEYLFKNTYTTSGISFEETNADVSIADIDNDGDLDLYLTSIYRGRVSHLYLNDGAGVFKDVSWISGTRVGNAYGAAFADYDNDGFPDLLVASDDGVRLFKNNGNENHWLKIRIRDEGCNRFGVGAKVRISYDGKHRFREVRAGRGAGNQDEIAVSFGLGSYSGPVMIRVHTLCGDSMTKLVPHPNRIVTMKL